MSDADKAYKVAQRLIAEVLEDGGNSLEFDTEETHALTTLPPEIADLTGITTLTLANTQVTNLTPIAELAGLTTLILDNTQVTNLASIASLTGLTTLTFANTQVADLTPVAGLTGLTTLTLTNTQVKDIAPIAGLTGLKALTLAYTQVMDLIPVAGLTGLTTLSIASTQVTDLTPVAGLTRLEWLTLNNTQVTDLTPVAGLTGLIWHSIANTQVTDLTPVANLTGLTWLSIANTQVTDLTPVAGLKELTTLNLNNTQVTDISPVAGLTGLTTLTLNDAQVADLRPLLPLVKLAKAPEYDGLSFRNTPPTKLDSKLADLAEIKNTNERVTKTFAYLHEVGDDWPPDLDDTRKTRAYLREVGDDWPPLPTNVTPIAPQSGKGFQYAPTGSGPIGYNNPATAIEPTSQLAQLHTLLQSELKKFLQSSPGGGEFHQRLVDKVAAYQANLGASVSELVPIMVWKSGNDLRIELRETNGQQGPSINTPPLDVDRRTGLAAIVTLHNAFASLHPEIAELDGVELDPADRHVSELTHEVLSDALIAINAQVVLLIDDVRRDLQDLHAEAMTDGKAALRALNLEDESLQNLIKAIVAEAVIETQGGGILSKIGGDVRGAVVGGAVGATATALGPEVAANYTQLVTALEPYMGQLITAWHGPDSNIKSTIDWVMLRLRMNPK